MQLRGGDPWSRGPLAPEHQHGWTQNDKGALPKEASSTLAFSRVAESHVGGNAHQRFKEATVKSWQYERAIRAAAIDDRQSMEEAKQRASLTSEVVRLTVDAAEKGVQSATVDVPAAISSWVGGAITSLAGTAGKEPADAVAGGGNTLGKRNTHVPPTCRKLAAACTDASSKAIGASILAEQAVAKARKEMAKSKLAQLKTAALPSGSIVRQQQDLKFVEPPGVAILRVVVVEARNLPKMDAFFGKVDPFAEVTLVDPDKPDTTPEELESRRTRIIHSNYDPAWNDAMEFVLPSQTSPEPRSELILVDVFDYDAPNAHRLSEEKEFIGQVVIPLKSFLTITQARSDGAEGRGSDPDEFSSSMPAQAYVHRGACDRWFDLRSADNGEVVHGHRFSGSPASIHLLISYQDAAERGKQRSNMAVYIAPRVGREQRVMPAPHPGWTDHPENMTDGDDPWAKFLAI